MLLPWTWPFLTAWRCARRSRAMKVRELRRSAKLLDKSLLPADPDPTAPLGAREQFLTRAYLMLGCALVEEFLESSFANFVDAHSQKTGKRSRHCFVSLAATFADDLKGQSSVARTDEDVTKLLSGLYANKVLKPNNGVQRRHIRALANPLGLYSTIEDDCEDLLRTTDTLGSRRGETAHLGNVTRELRPAEARGIVKDALDQLGSLRRILKP